MNALRGITGRSLSYSDEDHLLTAGDATYQYDLDGFLTTRTWGTDVTTYDYSSRGELLSVNLPDGRLIEYVHDPLDRRIAKKVDGLVVEKYLWQGLARLLAVYDGGGNLIMRFEYADARMPGAMTRNGSIYYLMYDQVGFLRVVADATGNVIKKVDYDSFGNIINDTNPTFKVPFGFAGGLHDRYTGLVRFGFRDYDPDVGRWTSKDPIGFAGLDLDLYGYCLDDPVNWFDSLGLRPLTEGEIKFLQTVYGNSVNYSQVDIRRGGLLTLTGNAVTIGNVIRFPSSAYKEDFSKACLSYKAWLVHEIGHVWQHQNLPEYHWSKAAIEHLKCGDKVYDYRLDKSKKLTEYRYEQQAKILQDYFFYRELGKPVDLYEAII